MSDCLSPASPVLSFYAAAQIPGLLLPLTAMEYLAESAFVSITAAGLVNASSFPAKPAHAFVRAAAASGSQVYVQLDGVLGGFAGLTQGGAYFLSTSGRATSGYAASGISQCVGVAADANSLLVHIEPPAYLA